MEIDQENINVDDDLYLDNGISNIESEDDENNKEPEDQGIGGDSIDELLMQFRQELDSIRSLSVFTGKGKKENEEDNESEEVDEDDALEEIEIEKREPEAFENVQFDPMNLEKEIKEFSPNKNNSLKLENIQLRNDVSKLNSRVNFLESQVQNLQKNFNSIIHLLRNRD